MACANIWASTTGLYLGLQPRFQRLVRTLEWKYSYASSGASQLYNLEKDPGETANLIEDPKAGAARTEMHGRLVRWMRETGDFRKIG